MAKISNMKDTLFGELISDLFAMQKAKWGLLNPSTARAQEKDRIDSRLITQLHSDLRSLNFTSEDEINVVSKWIPLPPIDKEAHLVPYMQIKYSRKDRTYSNTGLRIYLLMLCIRNSDLHGIGIRIESLERNWNNENAHDVGRHDFYHAQLCKSIDGMDLKVHDWIPENQPSFPIWASEPIDALLNVIVTLYGAVYYKAFVAEGGRRYSNNVSEDYKVFHSKLVT